ncbi:MAG: hypothetical protein QOJ77_1735 [Microbacteriaceae bacterium]|nr:hypothetical protein [Microbacteriaceae bacterium]
MSPFHAEAGYSAGSADGRGNVPVVWGQVRAQGFYAIQKCLRRRERRT